MTSLVARVCRFAMVATGAACTSNHDLLAEKPSTTGAGGAAADATAMDGTFPPVTRPDGSGGGSPIDPEPAGPWALTVLNGVVDAPAVRLCFVPVVDGGEAAGDDAPVPPSPGLAFGERLVLWSLGSDPTVTDVHPYLVIGADGANAARSCRALIDATGDGGAGAPQTFALPLLPAGTLGASRSYLGVLGGCAYAPPVPDAGPVDASDAGDASDDADTGAALPPGNNPAICGMGFGPTTLGLSLVRLSRQTSYPKLGFQTVNASLAIPSATVAIQQAGTETVLLTSDALTPGQIGPRAQPSYIGEDDLGITPRSAAVRVDAPSGAPHFPTFQTTLGNVLTTNQIDDAALTEGAGFAFVLIGAQPGQVVGPGQHEFRLGFVMSAPMARDD